MPTSFTLPLPRLHPAIAQMGRTARKVYCVQPSPTTDPELVRQLLGQQPAQSEHSADAI